MAIETFNRFENKYLIDETIFNRLQAQFANKMKLDDYNPNGSSYTISNLYYDTEDNQLIRNSLAKPKYKEKLRLRAYGVPTSPDEIVYVEIKRKSGGLVNKRRSALELQQAYNYLESKTLPEEGNGQNRQVLKEIGWLLQTQKLSPALYLAYDRIAYFGIEEADLRISFDRKLRTRRYDLALEAGDHGTNLLEDNQILMEIKVARSLPLWLAGILSREKIYPISFSKYGVEYQNMLKNKQLANTLFHFQPLDSAFREFAKAAV